MTTYIQVDNRSLGVNFTDNQQAEVTVWAPNAHRVDLKVDGRSTVIPLTHEDLGCWCVSTSQIKPGDLYAFVLDGEKELPDPASLAQPRGVHGPSLAVDVRQFVWTDGSWKNPPLAEYLIYELHVGTFTPEGTFAAIIEKLDYLVELGITAIEIMPVAQFPDSRNWGYDGVFPYAVQDSYGGIDGLKQLVDACHQKGVAVVLDVVYNHIGPEGNYFREFGPYFTSKHLTPWGDAVNFDDVWCDGVRQYYIENALMWFRDFHIDALRLDAVHAIKDESPVHILREIREHVDQLMSVTGRSYYLIVESDLNDPRYISSPNEGGYGMDAQWIDEFHHALRVTAGQERFGYYGDFSGIDHLAKAYRDVYVYDGQFSAFRKRLFGSKVETEWGQQFVVFSQNHDQIGNRMMGERTSQLVSFDMLKVMAGAVLASPFLPLLFMGEEWGESNPFLYFVSHTDPDLADAVREGRKAEFASFHQDGEAPDPMAADTFGQSKLQWDLQQRTPHQTLLRYYQTLIALRKALPALRNLNRNQLEVFGQPDQPTLVLHRWYEEEHVLCLLNFARQAELVTLPALGLNWQNRFDSTGPQWAAIPDSSTKTTPDTLSDGQILTLPPNRLFSICNVMTNPIATYRLQFHKDFTFTDFERIIPYLTKLGVKTVYASPIFEAVPGSVHGYDSVDPHRINPEIGTETQLKSISRQLTQRGIGWLQDIVPNHTAFHPANAWLMDVLEKGEKSLYAPFFDINWTTPEPGGRLMVPFLGSPLAETISNGELSVAWQPQRLGLAYYDTAYPLHLRSYATVLRAGNGEPTARIQELLNKLPGILALDEPKAFALAVAGFQAELAAELTTKTGKAWLNTCLKAIGKDPVLIQQLADEQVYELCSHAETDHRINYRRFFTVNSLICLNIQNPDVFDHFHERISGWLNDGIFQGLRIDHIDGLYDPSQYLNQLRTLAGDEAYIVVEKILQADEALPSWPIQGETGYAYLAMVNNLFTLTGSRAGFTKFYHKLLGEKTSIPAELHDKKRYILLEHMGGELDNLYHLLLDLTLVDRNTLASLAPDSLKSAIGEFLVQCPVYRYYGNSMPLTGTEAEAVRTSLGRVGQYTTGLAPAADVLTDVLLTKPESGDADYSRRALRFYQRCMQFTGPLMAKGVEDTLMYTYARFIGHDEVGDSPAFFGLTFDAFHQKMVDRQRHWPMSLNATSTHDTKRGEGVRSRLNVLTDLTDEWIAEVEAWQKINAGNKVKSDDTDDLAVDAPDANDEYFIYQTLIGAYPMPGQDDDDFPNRLAEYLQKALREAKRYSTWNNPDETYEAATQRFAATLLDQKKPFWKRFAPFHRQIADFGIINSLAQVVLKCTCPGVPDIYQGCENWDLSLVDPDNRRPVDFSQREQALDELIAREGDPADVWRDLWHDRYDSRIKLWLVHTLLNERSRQPDLFAKGDYIPLTVKGRHKQHVFAFARRYQKQWYVVAVPMGLARLCRAQQVDECTPDWADTRIILPEDAPQTWEHQLLKTTGTVGDGIAVSAIFGTVPLAILKLEQPANERTAGILMHITSLPAPFGIGDFGPAARAFADFLSRSHQTYWQLLPLNPVESGQGHSPYSSNSSMAGSPLLLSPDVLAADGWLTADELEQAYIEPGKQVNFTSAKEKKDGLFDKAYDRFRAGASADQQQQLTRFCEREGHWLDDFALYSVLKKYHRDAAWFQWPTDYKLRRASALNAFAQEHADAIDKVKWLQFMFMEQWQSLKTYCNNLGIRLFGDLPFYLSYDSVDVWAHTDIFSVDKDGQMIGVAGVPPDYFNADGQLWGMPVFRWEVLKKQGYRWWIERLRKNMELYDLLRLDHFRAFADYWEVAASEKTAISGEWKLGPGIDFFRALQDEFGQLPFVAEDLGEISADVYTLRDAFNLPGMKVAQFAFGESMPVTVNVPHNYVENAIAYTGTHDNNTSRGWYRQDKGKAEVNRLIEYVGHPVTEENVHLVLSRLVYASVAKTAILPIQDILGLDETARMNTPAGAGSHWGWRLLPEELTPAMETWLRNWTTMYHRW